MSFDPQQIRYIAKNYNPLDYIPKLQALLKDIEPVKDYAKYQKFELHQLINTIILENYPGEQVLKYLLFKNYQDKKLVAAFEVNVNKSRLDFLTVNGHTTSFEIKSDLDNLDKLGKQSKDYLRAFEFNNIVVQTRHLKKAIEIIPEHFGILSFHDGRKTVHRPSTLNSGIDSEQQLRLLNKKELQQFYGSKHINEISKEKSDQEINELFKVALKSRYETRWNFITTHAEQILPVDLQFFFNMNIHPDLIYA